MATLGNFISSYGTSSSTHGMYGSGSSVFTTIPLGSMSFTPSEDQLYANPNYEATSPLFYDLDNVALGGSGYARSWMDQPSPFGSSGIRSGLDESFGLLAGFYGPMIRQAFATPIEKNANTTQFGDVSVTIDPWGWEKENTFGTPDYFRKLGLDYLYANTSYEDKLAAEKILYDINPVSYAALPTLMQERAKSIIAPSSGGTTGPISTSRNVSISGGYDAYKQLKGYSAASMFQQTATEKLSAYGPRLSGQDKVINGRQYNDAGIPTVATQQQFQTFLMNPASPGAFTGPVHSITAKENKNFQAPNLLSYRSFQAAQGNGKGGTSPRELGAEVYQRRTEEALQAAQFGTPGSRPTSSAFPNGFNHIGETTNAWAYGTTTQYPSKSVGSVVLAGVQASLNQRYDTYASKSIEANYKTPAARSAYQSSVVSLVAKNSNYTSFSGGASAGTTRPAKTTIGYSNDVYRSSLSNLANSLNTRSNIMHDNYRVSIGSSRY